VPLWPAGTVPTDTIALPLVVPFAAVIVVVPADNAVNLPVASIVPTAGLLLTHENIAEIMLPSWSSAVAVKVCVPLTATDAVEGETVIVVNPRSP